MAGARAALLASALVAAGALAAGTAAAVERNFAGSAQLDYHWVPPEEARPRPRRALDGFTLEAALKLAADVSERVSANVKVCHGCHGFELPMAYLDYRIADELNIRAGRFSPSFGAFNVRHDPANHPTSSKPLPYDMGRMLRWGDWNLGVLPSPFPDNGVEVGGTHWFGERVQVDYAAHAVAGFRADRNSVDLDWSRSLSTALYVVDNNGRPSVGGRASITLRLGEADDLTAGASVMHGTFDPDNDLAYTIAGGDLSARWGRTHLRLEYLVRRQTFAPSPAVPFQEPIAPRETFHKHGYYLEVERAMTEALGVVVRADGLHRVGNLPAASPLTPRSSIARYTAGITLGLPQGLRLKASTELWFFGDRLGEHEDAEVTLHLGVVGTY
jgi:hypothetical protein